MMKRLDQIEVISRYDFTRALESLCLEFRRALWRTRVKVEGKYIKLVADIPR